MRVKSYYLPELEGQTLLAKYRELRQAVISASLMSIDASQMTRQQVESFRKQCKHCNRSRLAKNIESGLAKLGDLIEQIKEPFKEPLETQHAALVANLLEQWPDEERKSKEKKDRPTKAKPEKDQERKTLSGRKRKTKPAKDPAARPRRARKSSSKD